jgi:pimeloyl-ACP methyl ester carboxylesterase
VGLMQKRILLVHGIYSKEGLSNVWNMRLPLQQATGLPVEVFEYGYTHPVQARFSNPNIAKRLAHVMEPGDIIVCHSNGAAVTWLATHNEGARPSGVVLINPALDVWRMPICDWAHVYYNAGDDVTWWSQFLLGNIWGDMGKVGYIPPDLRHAPDEAGTTQVIGGDHFVTHIRQVDTEGRAGFFNAPPARGHTAMFQTPCVIPWGKVVGQRIMTELNQ